MGHLPPDFRFSQSSLQNYVDCPRRFQLRYLQKQQYPAPQVDNMLEFEQRMTQGERFHQAVHQHLIGIPADLLTKRLHDDNVRGWFETYLAKGLDNVPPRIFPEQTLTVSLDEVLIMAKFDLVAIGAKVVIIDWKTSPRLPKREWMTAKMQTIVYRYVLAKGGAALNKGAAIAPESIEMRYWYPAQNGASLIFDYDAAQFEQDEAYLREIIHEIDTRPDFPLTDDENRCKFCTYRSLCERGTVAGNLDEWEDDFESIGLDDFEIDIEQIVEIEF